MDNVLYYEVEDNQGKVLKTVETVKDLTAYADSLTEDQAWDMFAYAILADNTAASVTFDGEIIY